MNLTAGVSAQMRYGEPNPAFVEQVVEQDS